MYVHNHFSMETSVKYYNRDDDAVDEFDNNADDEAVAFSYSNDKEHNDCCKGCTKNIQKKHLKKCHKHKILC